MKYLGKSYPVKIIPSVIELLMQEKIEFLKRIVEKSPLNTMSFQVSLV